MKRRSANRVVAMVRTISPPHASLHASSACETQHSDHAALCACFKPHAKAHCGTENSLHRMGSVNTLHGDSQALNLCNEHKTYIQVKRTSHMDRPCLQIATCSLKLHAMLDQGQESLLSPPACMSSFT